MKTRSVWPTLFGTLLSALLTFSPIVAQTKAPQPEEAKTKIRCITAFVRLDRSSYQLQISEAAKFLKIAQTTFESRDFTVQTLRIATQPFSEYTQGLSHEAALQFFKNLDGLAQMQNVIISVGPAYLEGDDGDAEADLLACGPRGRQCNEKTFRRHRAKRSRFSFRGSCQRAASHAIFPGRLPQRVGPPICRWARVRG